MTTTSINETLKERERRYGDFTEHARVTQAIKDAIRDSRNWSALPPEMKESLEMVAHKLGRILSGDSAYKDSWHDIVGYIVLVEQDL